MLLGLEDGIQGSSSAPVRDVGKTCAQSANHPTKKLCGTLPKVAEFLVLP